MTESVLIEPKLFRLRALSTETTDNYSPRKRKEKEEPLTPEQVILLRFFDRDKNLTKIQIESTLAFLLLSTERTVKMTQAYYDYGAMEQLLEERERDLELAARIGQTLLEKNRQLIEQVLTKTAVVTVY